MIKDLDTTIATLLHGPAAGPELSHAAITFELPDRAWLQRLADDLTVNCYLHAVAENLDLRTAEPLLQRSGDGQLATWREPPAHLDCTYAVTAWSRAEDGTLDEHRLLSQVVRVLLRHREFPRDALAGALVHQPLHSPTGNLGRDGVATRPEFWSALEQRPRPVLVYVVTLAVFVNEPGEPVPTVASLDHLSVGGDVRYPPVSEHFSAEEVVP
ncbi:DUF4255 domain-containing protein [Actinoplanes awajinensis]|uniref:Pvc16 N-terminal domain-containing protein n=1 Tax=Actinoplanes awajinensis subsp. mycoplanecinus TaxID=135947 RepID=A0A101JF38_9ACTN|nr:DUF4255 domain-containing protein [Actinoplanes awajinensis]KUL25590.1 hypothetical protein ADL15_40305 [Actinoplanes awajinensis subsp. mycoplanecinus]